MRLRTLVCTVALIGATGFSTPARPSAQGPNPQSSSLDEATQKAIRELKLQEIEVERRGDLVKARELYDKILHLNPDDLTARQEFNRLDGEIRKQAEETAKNVVGQHDAAVTENLIRTRLDAIRREVADASSTGDSKPLKAAQDDLDDLKKLAKQSNRLSAEREKEFATVQALIEDVKASQRAHFWELWGGIGLVACAGVGLGVWYLLGRGRALEIIDGPDIGQTFALRKPTNTLGALASEVDWVLSDPMRKVSRHHCDILKSGRHYFVVDCSTNGTFLNGQLLRKGEPVLLRRGDQIGLGGEVVVRFR